MSMRCVQGPMRSQSIFSTPTPLVHHMYFQNPKIVLWLTLAMYWYNYAVQQLLEEHTHCIGMALIERMLRVKRNVWMMKTKNSIKYRILSGWLSFFDLILEGKILPAYILKGTLVYVVADCDLPH